MASACERLVLFIDILENNNLELFQSELGIKYNNHEKLVEALTHNSFVNESKYEDIDSNERLEYLGDAVLELIVSELLFELQPHKSEGDMTIMRSHIVRKETLADAAQNLGLGKWLRVGKGLVFSEIALNKSILSNTYEALTGSIFLDLGYESAKKFVENTLKDKIISVQNNEVKKAYANSEVILSGGSLQSPQILQLSGIGPAELLKKHDIPIIFDSPEVGQNLQDHYQVRGIVKLKNNNGSVNNQSRNPFKIAEWGLRWLLFGSGPLTCGAGQVGGAACSRFSKKGRPDLQFNVMPLSVDKPGEPLHNYPGFTASVWQCHPESRGSLKIKSTNPKEQAEIRPEYLSTKLDQNVIVDGIKMIRSIFNQPSFRDLWEKEMLPGDSVKSDEEILHWAKHNGGTVFHAVGTCRMGNDSKSVVDEELNVRGVENLRVIDASVMPQVTSANTNAPSLMIGEKGVSFITKN